MSYHWAVDVFAALADPVRRRLLTRLAAGPARVVDLAAEEDISRPGVSKHLRLLGEAGLVRAERRGRERHYRLDPAALDPVTALVDALRQGAAAAGQGAGRTGVRAAGPSPAARFTEHDLAGLELEVRRTVRDRAGGSDDRTGHDDGAGEAGAEHEEDSA